MYTIYADLRDKKGLKDSDVATATGISKGTFSHWKAGTHSPSYDTLKKIADFFGVSVEYLKTGTEPSYQYYFDSDVAEIAQELHDNAGLRLLFDASRNVSESDLKFVIDLVQRMAKYGE